MKKKVSILALFFAFFYYIFGAYVSIVLINRFFPFISPILNATISVVVGIFFGLIGYKLGGK